MAWEFKFGGSEEKQQPNSYGFGGSSNDTGGGKSRAPSVDFDSLDEEQQKVFGKAYKEDYDLFGDEDKAYIAGEDALFTWANDRESPLPAVGSMLQYTGGQMLDKLGIHAELPNIFSGAGNNDDVKIDFDKLNKEDQAEFASAYKATFDTTKDKDAATLAGQKAIRHKYAGAQQGPANQGTQNPAFLAAEQERMEREQRDRDDAATGAGARVQQLVAQKELERALAEGGIRDDALRQKAEQDLDNIRNMNGQGLALTQDGLAGVWQTIDAVRNEPAFTFSAENPQNDGFNFSAEQTEVTEDAVRATIDKIQGRLAELDVADVREYYAMQADLNALNDYLNGITDDPESVRPILENWKTGNYLTDLGQSPAGQIQQYMEEHELTPEGMAKAFQEYNMQTMQMALGLLTGDGNIDLYHPTLDKWGQVGTDLANWVNGRINAAMSGGEMLVEGVGAGAAGAAKNTVNFIKGLADLGVLWSYGLADMMFGTTLTQQENFMAYNRDMVRQPFQSAAEQIGGVEKGLWDSSGYYREQVMPEIKGLLTGMGMDDALADGVASKVMDALQEGARMYGNMLPGLIAGWMSGGPMLEGAGFTGMVGRIVESMKNPSFLSLFMQETGDAMQTAYDKYGNGVTAADLIFAMGSGAVNAIIENYETKFGFSNGVQAIANLGRFPKIGELLGGTVSEMSEELKQHFSGYGFENLADLYNGRELSHAMDTTTKDSLFNVADYLDIMATTAVSTLGMNVLAGAGSGAAGYFRKAVENAINGNATPQEMEAVQKVVEATVADAAEQVNNTTVTTPTADDQHKAFEDAAGGENRGNDGTPGSVDQRAQAAVTSSAAETAPSPEGKAREELDRAQAEFDEQQQLVLDTERHEFDKADLDAKLAVLTEKKNALDRARINYEQAKQAGERASSGAEAEPSNEGETQAAEPQAQAQPSETPEALESRADSLEQMGAPQKTVEALRQRAAEMREQEAADAVKNQQDQADERKRREQKAKNAKAADKATEDAANAAAKAQGNQADERNRQEEERQRAIEQSRTTVKKSGEQQAVRNTEEQERSGASPVKPEGNVRQEEEQVQGTETENRTDRRTPVRTMDRNVQEEERSGASPVKPEGNVRQEEEQVQGTEAENRTARRTAPRTMDRNNQEEERPGASPVKPEGNVRQGEEERQSAGTLAPERMKAQETEDTSSAAPEGATPSPEGKAAETDEYAGGAEPEQPFEKVQDNDEPMPGEGEAAGGEEPEMSGQTSVPDEQERPAEEGGSEGGEGTVPVSNAETVNNGEGAGEGDAARQQTERQNAGTVSRQFGWNHLQNDEQPAKAGVNIRTWRGTSVSESYAGQLQAADKWAKRHNVVVIADSTLEGGIANGSYSPTDKQGRMVIHIAQDAADPLKAVFSHEMMHLIRANNPKAYAQIEKAVFDYLGRAGVDINNELEKIRTRYKNAGKEITNNAVLREELTANSVFDAIGDENTIRALAAQDRGLVQRIHDWVQRVMKEIREMMNQYTDRTPGAKALQETEGAMERLRAMIEQAMSDIDKLNESKKTVQALGENGNMTRDYQQRVAEATNRKELNGAAELLAWDMLDQMGQSGKKENLRKLTLAAYTWAATGGTMAEALQEYGFAPWGQNAEMNRAFAMLGKYAQDALMEGPEVFAGITNGGRDDINEWLEKGVRYSPKDNTKMSKIKDEIRNNQERLNSMDVKIHITSNVDLSEFYEKGVRDYRSAWTSWAKKNIANTEYHRDLYGTLKITKSQITEAMSHCTNAEECVAVSAVPEVLKYGIEIFHFGDFNMDEGDFKGRGIASLTIAAPVELDGIRCNMAVVLHNGKHGRTYHAHRIILPNGKAINLIPATQKQEMAHVTDNADNNQQVPHASPVTDIKPQEDDGVKLSLKDNSRDQQYQQAIDSGNVEEQQRLVKEAASKAGYIPVTRYHQTGERFTEFKTDNPVAGANDSETPNGIFFKENDHDIGVDGDYVNIGHGGDIQMQVYLKMNHPLHFANRNEAKAWYEQNVPGYKELSEEWGKINSEKYEPKFKEIEDEMFAADTTDERYEELDHQEEELIKELSEEETSYRKRMRELLNDYFLNGKSDYDGIELVYDGSRYIDGKKEAVHTYIVFDPTQVKSADPVTYDDAGNPIPLSERFSDQNPDIRWSMKDGTSSDPSGATFPTGEGIEGAPAGMTQEELQARNRELEAQVFDLEMKVDRAEEAGRQLVDEVMRKGEEIRKLRESKATRAELENARKMFKAALESSDKQLMQTLYFKEQRDNAVREQNRLRKMLGEQKAEWKAKIRKQEEGRVKHQQQMIRINKALNKLNSMMENPSKNKGWVPQESQKMVADFILAVSEGRGMDASMLGRNVQRALMKEDSEDMTQFSKALRMRFDETMGMLEEISKRPGSKSLISKAEEWEINAIMGTLEGVVHEIQFQDKLIGQDRAMETQEAGRQAIAHMEKTKRQTRGVLAKIRSFGEQHLNPSTWLDVMAKHGKNVISDINQEAKNGQRKMEKLQMDGELKFLGLTQDKNESKYRAYLNDVIETKYTAVDFEGKPTGKTMRLNHDMLTALYMHWMSPENREAMKIPQSEAEEAAYGERFQIAVPDLELIQKGKLREAMANTTRYVLTEAQMKALFSEHLTDYDRQWGASFNSAEADVWRPALNDTSMKLYGWEVADVEKYFPINRDQNYIAKDFDSVVSDNRIANMGKLKKRVTSSKPVILIPMTQVVAEQNRDVARFAGLAIPVRDMTALYNAAMPGYGNSVKEAMKKNWGTDAAQYYENMVADLQGARDMPGGFMSKLRSAYAKGVLSLNASVTGKQAASAVTAAGVVHWSSIGKAMRTTKKAPIEQIQKYTAGYYMRTSDKLSDMEANVNRTGFAAKGANRLMTTIAEADKWTTRRMMWAAYYEVQDHMGLKEGTEEFWQTVARVYDDILEVSQPTSGVMQKDAISRSTSETVKSLTMFRTQISKNLNAIVNTVTGYSDAKAALRADPNNETLKKEAAEARRKMAGTISGQVTSAIILSVMTAVGKALFHKMRDYEDDKGDLTPESVAGQLLRDAGSSFAGMIVGGSELYDLILGVAEGKQPFDIEAAGVSTINDLYQNTFGLMTKAMSVVQDGSLTTDQRWKKMQPSLWKFAGSISEMLGIPLNNARNLVDGIAANAKDMIAGKPGSFQESGLSFIGAAQGRETSNKAVAGYIAQAMMDGNEAEAVRLYNEQLRQGKTADALNTAIATWQKENIPEIRQAAEAIDQGDLSTYNRLINELTGMGLSMTNAVKYVEAARKKMNEEPKKEPEQKALSYQDIVAGMTKATKTSEDNSYTNGMMNSLLEDGNIAGAMAVRDDMLQNGKTQTNISSSLSSYWKPRLQEAYAAGDMVTVRRITEMLVQMGLKRTTVTGWATGTTSSSSSSSGFGSGGFGSSGFGKKSSSKKKSGFGSGSFGSGKFGK